jgi:hypothetical protein
MKRQLVCLLLGDTHQLAATQNNSIQQNRTNDMLCKKNACNGKSIIIIVHYCYYYYTITLPQMSLLQYYIIAPLIANKKTELALIQGDHKALRETGSVNKFESNLHCKHDRSSIMVVHCCCTTHS